MICPMMSYHREHFTTISCEKEKCAWYNKDCEECALLVLAKKTDIISEAAEGQRTIFIREV